MASSAYLDAVCQYLRADGWELSSDRFREGSVLLRGRQPSIDGDKSILTMVVTAEDGRPTAVHLKQLVETSRTEDIDLPILAAELPVDDKLEQAAAKNEIHILEREPIRELEASAGDSVSASPVEASDSVSTPPAESIESTAETTAIEPPTLDPRKRAKAYLTSQVSRRQLLAAGGLMIGGVAAAGYGWQRFGPTGIEAIKADAETIPYNELAATVEAYLGTPVYYGPARLAQQIDTDDGSHWLRLQVTQSKQDGTWSDDLLGRWDGERQSVGTLVEFWGIVDGTVRYETELGNERTVPELDLVDIAVVDL